MSESSGMQTFGLRNDSKLSSSPLSGMQGPFLLHAPHPGPRPSSTTPSAPRERKRSQHALNAPAFTPSLWASGQGVAAERSGGRGYLSLLEPGVPSALRLRQKRRSRPLSHPSAFPCRCLGHREPPALPPGSASTALRGTGPWPSSTSLVQLTNVHLSPHAFQPGQGPAWRKGNKLLGSGSTLASTTWPRRKKYHQTLQLKHP